MGQEREVIEYRGIEKVVYAEVLEDSAENFTTGTVKSLAGIAELSRKTTTSSATHYYDNRPVVVINSTGSDEVSLKTSAVPLDIIGEITGQKYDSTKGALIEGECEQKYFALGYITKDTSDNEVYVWRLKGKFSVPDENHKTKDDGTDAEGQELTYTGVSTNHKFAGNNNKPAKAINVELAKDLADVSTFFDTVTTPDTLQAKA